MRPEIECLERKQLLAISLSMLSPPAATEQIAIGSASLASFTFSAGKLADYGVTISWGDGTTSPGIIQAGTGGGGIVSGNHVYTQAGSDTISITVSGDSSTATGTAAETVIEMPPNSQPDFYTITHDHTLTTTTSGSGPYGVLYNDSDPQGDTLTATLVAQPQHGTLTFNSNGTFTYVPNAHFYGSDGFTYKDKNSTASSAVTPVTIIVTEQSPVAVNDNYTVTHDHTLSVTTASGYGTVGVLGNDTDADGDTLTTTVLTTTQHGTLTLNANGTFTYVPVVGFSGTDSFTYQASDGLLSSNIATATITVTESAPVANNDSYTVAHDHVLTAMTPSGYGTVGVLGNDTDADHDSLTAILVASPQHGTLTFNSNGTFAYVPNAGYSGTVSFTYKASDGLLSSNVATATITITESAPVAVNDTYTIGHDRVLAATAASGSYGTVGVLANDTDADSDTLTAALVSGPQHGVLALNPHGTFIYAPTAGYSGTDTFTYKAGDGLLSSGVATATISVVAPSLVANNDSYTVAHDHTLSSYPSVLANDTDAANSTLTASLLTTVQHGVLTFSPSGTFTYVPAAGYVGADSFTYQDSDGTLTSNAATVTITVGEHAPVANNDSYTIAHDRTITPSGYPYDNVLSNDTDTENDTLTATLVTGPQHGTLTLNANGTFTYVPTAHYSGTDSFTYQASDGLLSSNVATATITITESAPVAVNDTYTIGHDRSLSVTTASGYGSTVGVLGNDADADGDTLTATLVSGVQHGTLSFSPDGTFTYLPNPGFSGTDSFTYKGSDGLLSSNVATATITVTESAPAANNDTYTVVHDQTLSATSLSQYGSGSSGVLANDTDADGDTLTAALVTGVQHGTLTFNSNGTFTYVPNSGSYGTDSFTYQDSDGLLSSNVATATITVVEHAPAAFNTSETVAHDHTLSIAGVGMDPDGDPLTISIVTNVEHGTLTVSANNTFTYTPTAGFWGADSFTFKLSDGLLSSSIATVSIVVTESAPVANTDFYTVNGAQPITATSSNGVLANDSDADRDPLTTSLVSNVQHGT
ncbi:MAG: Ig-like domain-containing protein [Isosphaerales bacterium]